mmetsp:Transcript_106632/g.200918  ORF Transcript_106632/g.200918 Transcript_106632/m.200918 type:complete len:463 (-) Transcript_106632:90-1478(-)
MQKRSTSHPVLPANGVAPGALAFWLMPSCCGSTVEAAEAAHGVRPTTACAWDESMPSLSCSGTGSKLSERRANLARKAEGTSVKWRLRFNECAPVCANDTDYPEVMLDMEHRGWDSWAEVTMPEPSPMAPGILRHESDGVRKTTEPGTPSRFSPQATRIERPDDWAEEVTELPPAGLRPQVMDQVSSIKLRGGVYRSRIKGSPAPRQGQAQSLEGKSPRSPRKSQMSSLAGKFLKKSLGHANAAALSEAPGQTPVEVRFAEDSLDEVDVIDESSSQGGSCGFTVTIRRTQVAAAGRDLGMCHHFTWDGKHCVASALGSEHANRCAGRLYVCGAVADLQMCKTPLRCASCNTQKASEAGSAGSGACSSKIGDNEFVEVVCGPPARRGPASSCCNEMVCPFMKESGRCPYSAGVRALRMQEAQFLEWHGKQPGPMPPVASPKWPSPPSSPGKSHRQKKDTVCHL